MELLTTLMLGHLLADFPLQSNTIATSKTKSNMALFTHVAIHMIVTWGLLGMRWESFALVYIIGCAHLAVDWLKPRLLQTSAVRAFIIDQSVHLVCIVVAALAVEVFQPGIQLVFLPSILLYPSLFLGFAFGGMVLYWLWGGTHSSDVIYHPVRCKLELDQLLALEQRVGFGLVCLICISIFFSSR